MEIYVKPIHFWCSLRLYEIYMVFTNHMSTCLWIAYDELATVWVRLSPVVPVDAYWQS
nr:MAG TPA: hypothetical protein [Caudoviricetes sp.]